MQRGLAPPKAVPVPALNMWYPSLYSVLFPARRYVWCPIRILRETEKAILVRNGGKTWVPKSQIRGIRLRLNMFETYVREGMLA